MSYGCTQVRLSTALWSYNLFKGSHDIDNSATQFQVGPQKSQISMYRSSRKHKLLMYTNVLVSCSTLIKLQYCTLLGSSNFATRGFA